MYKQHIPILRFFLLILGVSTLSGPIACIDILPPPNGNGVNHDPTADAGADQTVGVGQRVTLDGLGSFDRDDDPLTFSWQQRSGPGVTLEDANSIQPSFLPVEEGIYEFALTVTDGRGGSDTSTVRVFVDGDCVGGCPRADAHVDQTVNEGSAVTLDGSNSADPCGRPLSYEWFQLSGAQISLNGVFIEQPSFVAPQVAGDSLELVFELTVTNEEACNDTDTVVITVQDRDPDDPCLDAICEDDGLFCNGVDACDPDTGKCVSSGDPCAATETTCNEVKETCDPPGCTEDADCDDGDGCTDDTCDPNTGNCVITPVKCPEGEVCDAETGDCVDLCASVECPEGEFCDSSTGDCVDLCSAVVCPEGQFCDPETSDCVELCSVVDCLDDGIFCNGTEECDPFTGACFSTGNPCEDGEMCDEDDGCTPCNDPDWAQRSTDGPFPRYNHAMAYDSCRGVVVLYGGQHNSPPTYFEDTWEWDGDTWTRVAEAGPGPHRSHAMAFDESRCVTVLFGGNDPSSNYLNDTWEWDGNTWTQSCASCAPPKRHYAGMVYDSTLDAILLFGGWSPGYLNDLWQWDGTAWDEVPTTSPKPSPRSAFAMEYDPGSHRTVVFGGAVVAATCAQDNTTADTWTLDMSMSPATWEQIATSTQPSPRAQFSMVYDSARSTMVLFGGWDYCSTLLDDTWEWNGSSWTEVTTTGLGTRYKFDMAYDATREEVVLFGGLAGETSPVVGDTWVYGGGCPR